MESLKRRAAGFDKILSERTHTRMYPNVDLESRGISEEGKNRRNRWKRSIRFLWFPDPLVSTLRNASSDPSRN